MAEEKIIMCVHCSTMFSLEEYRNHLGRTLREDTIVSCTWCGDQHTYADHKAHKCPDGTFKKDKDGATLY